MEQKNQDYPLVLPAMTTTKSVREQVAQIFAELGADHHDVRETILIRDGNYYARRFESPAGVAVWFVEEGQIKLFAADGALIRVVALHALANTACRTAA
jgi:hypothetical protein